MSSQSSRHKSPVRAAITALVSVCLVAGSTLVYGATQPTMKLRFPHTHVKESVRDLIETVVVMPHTTDAELGVFGTYERKTISVADAAVGASMLPLYLSIELIQRTPNALFPPELIIPFLVLPWTLAGAAGAKIQQEIQQFRDGLTDELTKSASPPLANEVIAGDLYSQLRRVPGIDANVIAESLTVAVGTDVVLFVKFTSVVIDIQKSDANIETGASATLRRVSDGKTLYYKVFYYQDEDKLKNWIEDDVALWRTYLHFARHYFARQITAELFEKYELRHELRPIPTESVVPRKDDNWQATSKSGNPTLAWDLRLMGRDDYGPWTDEISEANTFYDLEIYDNHRLIYSAHQIADPHHRVSQPLDKCQDLHWTVRPSYHVGGKIKYGEWMRYYTSANLDEGHVGEKASETPAFLRGFAFLKTACR